MSMRHILPSLVGWNDIVSNLKILPSKCSNSNKGKSYNIKDARENPPCPTKDLNHNSSILKKPYLNIPKCHHLSSYHIPFPANRYPTQRKYMMPRSIKLNNPRPVSIPSLPSTIHLKPIGLKRRHAPFQTQNRSE